MPFILSLAASLLGWGKIALAWLEKLPWYVLALAACAMMIVWQHHGEVSKDARIAALNATLAQVKEAQAQATVIAQQALAHEQAVYQQKATEADSAYQTQLAAAQSAADRYIASHSVQPATAQGGASTAVASAQGGSPASPDRPDNPADMVAVSADDINACTVNSTRLQAARDWALGLNSATP